MGNIKFKLVYIVIWMVLFGVFAYFGETYSIRLFTTIAKSLGILGIAAFMVLVYFGFKNLFSGK